jgi:pantetheine-phosphate adenylyltransferase
MIYGIYAGSFDPITYGHMDVIRKAVSMCHHFDIVVASNSAKKQFLPADARVELVKAALKSMKLSDDKTISVVPWEKLLAEYAQTILSADYNDGEWQAFNKLLFIRGLRTEADFQYEMPMAFANKDLCDVDSVFIPCKPEYQHISSTLVRELITRGAGPEAVSRYLPMPVYRVILKHLKESEK